jgi:hypothetical protein
MNKHIILVNEFFPYTKTLRMMEGVLVKLNPGLPWQKLNLTRRRIFSPANWN